MVLTVSFVLSPVIGLVVTVAGGKIFETQTWASGPHDFAVRVQHRSSAVLPCVHRIPPRVRDDRDTPLWWDETARTYEVIWVRRNGNIFANGTGQPKSD
jgi:hypothetical protein